jgi:hypothetical protein
MVKFDLKGSDSLRAGKHPASVVRYRRSRRRVSAAVVHFIAAVHDATTATTATTIANLSSLEPLRSRLGDPHYSQRLRQLPDGLLPRLRQEISLGEAVAGGERHAITAPAAAITTTITTFTINTTSATCEAFKRNHRVRGARCRSE